MDVRIRKEGDIFLAYFIEPKRLIEVNEVGAEILDMILNQDQSRSETAKNLAQKYSIPETELEEDIVIFLEQIQEELSRGGFNTAEQCQLTVPLGVELEINSSCNLRCRHCFQRHYQDDCMPLVRAEWILDQLSEAGVCEISIIGGEPLLHPNCTEIVRCCRERNFATSITTNGTLLDEELIEQIAQADLSVFVSLDGLEEDHNLIRGQGVFRKVNQAIRRLCENGVEVGVICTLNSINATRFRDVIAYCRDFGESVVCNFNLFKSFRASQEGLALQPETYFEIVFELFRMRLEGEAIGIPNAAIVSELLGISTLNECTATLSGLVIDCRGRMVTCPGLVAAGYYGEDELPLFDEHFLQTWKEHSSFVRFKENGMTGCQVRSYLYCGNVSLPDPYGIEAFRRYLREKHRQ